MAYFILYKLTNKFIGGLIYKTDEAPKLYQSMNNYNQLIIKRDILLNILARCYLIGDNDSYERIQQMI